MCFSFRLRFQCVSELQFLLKHFCSGAAPLCLDAYISQKAFLNFDRINGFKESDCETFVVGFCAASNTSCTFAKERSVPSACVSPFHILPKTAAAWRVGRAAAAALTHVSLLFFCLFFVLKT